ncbi:hypothetical protein JG688_00017696 [Phytophthora aleatoria]|uniref:Uncharacterized protein n=1 Tax=Phytophthora aleatoria TaxID=2496075 RepID=A0A8J5IC27_9STRA|nr:hypothetical protein JG688_00017696 [Phytophthora aleatoria]
MSLENLPWVPQHEDWLASVEALDTAEPWRNCWLEQLHLHPFDTVFLPCHPLARIFVPHGHTVQSVRRQIDIDSSVSASEVAVGWDHEWASNAS